MSILSGLSRSITGHDTKQMRGELANGAIAGALAAAFESVSLAIGFAEKAEAEGLRTDFSSNTLKNLRNQIGNTVKALA